MINQTRQLFTAHPEALNESYTQHFGHAMGYAWRLQKASFCALCHAVFPFLFEKTASTAIKTMYAEMTSRGATGITQATTKSVPAVE